MQNCLDSFHTTFGSYSDMYDYHNRQESTSRWKHSRISDLSVAPLDRDSSLFATPGVFAKGVSTEAVEDTADNLGLAIMVEHQYYPLRSTAYKSLLERAKIGGSALPKLSREDLANVLNACLRLYHAEALLLFRDEKVSAVHSGDASDYSVLPVNRLLETLRAKLDERFPRHVFESGYCDHALVSASWSLPEQKEDLLGAYSALLEEKGQKMMAARLMPGIRFTTSDTGISSAKVSALLTGGQTEIHIGGCVAVDHRHGADIPHFEEALDQLFAKFNDSVEKLKKLLEIELDYPVNAMTRICKKLSMPKKAAVEAIASFEMAVGENPASAHDVFMAMQEIMFILKTQNTPQGKLLAVEENMARALSLRWSDYDLAKGVDY